MAFADTDTPPALSQATPPGPLSSQGFNWDKLGQALMGMAPGIAQDPDHAKALASVAAAQQKVADNGTWSLHVMPNGQQVRINSKSGQTQLMPGNYAKPEEDPAVKQKAIWDASRTKANSDKSDTISTDANESRAALSQLQDVKAALADPNLMQGAGGDAMQTLRKFAVQGGLANADTATNGDVVRAAASSMTLASRKLLGGMPGSLSDSDREFLARANVSLNNTPGANMRILGIYEKLHQNAIEKDQDRIAHQQAHGGQLTDAFTGEQAAKYDKRFATENAAYAKAGGAATEFGAKAASGATKPTSFKTQSGVSWSIN